MLTIRLSRIGKKKKPYYRVVVIERTRPRDGRVKDIGSAWEPSPAIRCAAFSVCKRSLSPNACLKFARPPVSSVAPFPGNV